MGKLAIVLLILALIYLAPGVGTKEQPQCSCLDLAVEVQGLRSGEVRTMERLDRLEAYCEVKK